MDGNTPEEAAIYAAAAAGLGGALRAKRAEAGGVLPASEAAPNDLLAVAAEAEADGGGGLTRKGS